MVTPLPRLPFRSLVVLSALSAALLVPTAVAAHAELERARPADGATVEGTPEVIAGRFTQDINPDGSSMLLRDPAGETIAEGTLDPDNDRRMVITDVPELAPGEYTVRWTTNSAEDDEIARGTWSFTVVAAPSPSPSATATPGATASAAPSATAEPSVEPSASAEPSIAPSPAPSPAPDPGSAAGVGDVLLPIVAALAIVSIAAGYLLTRRRTTPPPA
jgi:methionine-rich copper-binding protein CopC